MTAQVCVPTDCEGRVSSPHSSLLLGVLVIYFCEANYLKTFELKKFLSHGFCSP